MKFLVFGILTMLRCLDAYSATKELYCRSYDKVEGWTGSSTNDYVWYKAEVASRMELRSAAVSGAYETNAQDLTADEDNENKFTRTRFQTLEDAWCWFNLLVPKDFDQQQSRFSGSVQYICEDEHQFSYINMFCYLNDKAE